MSKLWAILFATVAFTAVVAEDGSAQLDSRFDSRISLSGGWWGPTYDQPAGGSLLPTGDSDNHDDGGNTGGDTTSNPNTGGTEGQTLPGVGKMKPRQHKSFLETLLHFLDWDFFSCWP